MDNPTTAFPKRFFKRCSPLSMKRLDEYGCHQLQLPPTPVVAKQPYVFNVVYLRRSSVRISVNFNHVKTEIAVPMPPHQPACACSKQIPFLPPVDRPKSAGPSGTSAMRLHLNEHNAASVRHERDDIKLTPPVLSARMQIPPENAPSKSGQIAHRDILPPTPTRHTAVDIRSQRTLRRNFPLGNEPFETRQHNPPPHFCQDFGNDSSSLCGKCLATTANSTIHDTYHITHSHHLHGNVSNDAQGQPATVSDTKRIPQAHPAAMLLNSAPSGVNTKDAKAPTALKTTAIAESGTTKMFANMPPTDILPKIIADSGVPAIHDDRDMPSAPSVHSANERHRERRAALAFPPIASFSIADLNIIPAGDENCDVQRIQSTIPSITANDSAHPASNTIAGETAYTAKAAIPHAARESGRRLKIPAPSHKDIISAARTALGRAPVSITYAVRRGMASAA